MPLIDIANIRVAYGNPPKPVLDGINLQFFQAGQLFLRKRRVQDHVSIKIEGCVEISLQR